MTLDGGGAGDPFDGMTHQDMLKWLQHTDHRTMQAAADKLASAAREIHRIANDLGTRPQHVAWKGEGAEAFRAWGADIAKSTTALGDFSAHAGKWLGEAAVAVGNTKSRIPPVPPDDGKGHAHASGSLGPGAKTPEQEKARQEAAQEMRKLGQSYAQASGQMDSFRRPVFPPMPDAIAPPRRIDDARQDVSRTGSLRQMGSIRASSTGSARRQHGEDSAIVGTAYRQNDHLTALPEHSQVSTDLDSVETLPKPPQTHLPDNPAQPPTATGRTEPALPVTPPALGGTGKPLPTARGGMPTEKPVTGGRVPPRSIVGGTPQQQKPTSPVGRAANPSRGIVGGRPTQQSPTGRPTNMSRGPIVGGKSTQTGKSSTQGGVPRTGRGTGTPRTPVRGTGLPKATPPGSAQKTPRTTNAVPSRGVTGPRGLPPQTTGGVIGSNAQNRDRSGRLPSGTSAQPRGGIVGGVPNNEPPKRMQDPSTGAVPPGAGNAPHQEEKRQTTNQKKKPPQPQPGVNTAPKKRDRP